MIVAEAIEQCFALGGQRASVLRVLLRVGDDGATDDEIADAVDSSKRDPLRSRRRELVYGGLVERSGKKRPGVGGKPATVWRAVAPEREVIVIEEVSLSHREKIAAREQLVGTIRQTYTPTTVPAELGKLARWLLYKIATIEDSGQATDRRAGELIDNVLALGRAESFVLRFLLEADGATDKEIAHGIHKSTSAVQARRVGLVHAGLVEANGKRKGSTVWRAVDPERTIAAIEEVSLAHREKVAAREQLVGTIRRCYTPTTVPAELGKLARWLKFKIKAHEVAR